jgi:energy-converting hydrogenase Eha subunit A
MSGHPVGVAAGRLVPPARYRHPGDVIRLIAGSAVLGCSLAASAAARRWLLGPAVPVTGGLGSGLAGRVLTGLVQVACVAAAVLVVAAALRRRRFRLLGGLAVAAAVAAGIVAGIFWLLGGQHPDALTDNLARGSWLASAAFPQPAVIAGAVAVIVAASPWMSRPWRRAAWLALLLVAAARIVTGTILPMELIIAIATGVMVGAGVLVAFGVPDQRVGAGEIAGALRSAGLPVETVRAAEVKAKGSRPFAAAGPDGLRWFIKAMGSDQRDADLLYRAYRAVRLRNVGDTRPAATLFQAVEHQALAGVMAERAGVVVPGVDRVVKAGGDTAFWLTFITVGELAKWAVVRKWGQDRRWYLDAWTAGRPVIPTTPRSPGCGVSWLGRPSRGQLPADGDGFLDRGQRPPAAGWCRVNHFAAGAVVPGVSAGCGGGAWITRRSVMLASVLSLAAAFSGAGPASALVVPAHGGGSRLSLAITA